jgi:hypothetical protein
MSLLTEILTTFIGDYIQLFLAFFGIGVSVLLTKSYSQASFTFMIITLVMYFIFDNPIFIGLSLASAVIGTIIKNSGM